jgi:hypothetical protein
VRCGLFKEEGCTTAMNKTEIIFLKLRYILGVFDGLKLQYPLGVFAGWARFYSLSIPELENYEGDVDVVVHPHDFEQIRLWKPDHCFKGSFGDEGVRVDNIYEIYPSVCGISYDQLKQGAVELGSYFVVSLPWLLAQASIVWASEPINQKARWTVEVLMAALDFKAENTRQETA